MVIQVTWLFIFILNLLILWSTALSGKGTMYTPAGLIIWVFTMVYLPFTPQPQLTSILTWNIIGTIILLLGLVLLTAARIKFIQTGPFSDYSQPPRLITAGPYKLVRHPQSLALILIFIGISVARGVINCLYLIPVIIFFHWVESFLEEKIILEKKFPNQYREYQQRVGMLLPKFR